MKKLIMYRWWGIAFGLMDESVVQQEMEDYHPHTRVTTFASLLLFNNIKLRVSKREVPPFAPFRLWFKLQTYPLGWTKFFFGGFWPQCSACAFLWAKLGFMIFPCGPRRPKNIQCIVLHVNPWCWIFHACVADQCLSKAEDGIVHRIRSRKPSVRMRLCHLVNICICLHISLQRTLHYWLQESFKKKEFMSKSLPHLIWFLSKGLPFFIVIGSHLLCDCCTTALISLSVCIDQCQDACCQHPSYLI